MNLESSLEGKATVRAVSDRVVASVGLAPVVEAAGARAIVAVAAAAIVPAAVRPVLVIAAPIGITEASLGAIGQVVVLGETHRMRGRMIPVVITLGVMGTGPVPVR